MPTKEQIAKSKKKRHPNPLKSNARFPPELIDSLTDLVGDMAIRQALKGATMAERMFVAAMIPEMLRGLRAEAKRG